MTATLDDVECNRCVLDTGAPLTTLVLRDDSTLPLSMVAENTAFVKSLRINQIEFGPLHIRVKRRNIDYPWDFAVYFGMEQMKDFCLAIDYARSFVAFSSEPYPHTNIGRSSITFFRGRPIVSIDYLGRIWRFVLDTGSDGNWLFFDAQDESLFEHGEVVEENQEVQTSFGNVSLRRALLLNNLSFGGVTHEKVKFLLTNEQGFGGKGTPESGIIGTGNVASFFEGIQIIDFIFHELYFGRVRNGTLKYFELPSHDKETDKQIIDDIIIGAGSA